MQQKQVSLRDLDLEDRQMRGKFADLPALPAEELLRQAQQFLVERSERRDG